MNYSTLFSAICKSGSFRPLQWRPGSKRSTHTINILQGHTSFANIPSNTLRFPLRVSSKASNPQAKDKGPMVSCVWHRLALLCFDFLVYFWSMLLSSEKSLDWILGILEVSDELAEMERHALAPRYILERPQCLLPWSESEWKYMN